MTCIALLASLYGGGRNVCLYVQSAILACTNTSTTHSFDPLFRQRDRERHSVPDKNDTDNGAATDVMVAVDHIVQH